MFRDRIEKIRNHLRDNVKDERFNLATWVGNFARPWLGHTDLSCGTTACVMGWATTIPEFQALGLHLEKSPDDDRGHLVFGEWKHFEAAAKFLDITEPEAEYMFNPDHYDSGEDASRLEAVERINDFLTYGMPTAYEDEDEEDVENDYDYDDEDESEEEDEDDE